MGKEIFDRISRRVSKQTAHAYSTSFSLAIRCLSKDLRDPIYGIYGFVRFADEIVDSFRDHDRRQLLLEFKTATYDAVDRGISLHPVLNSFQAVVHAYRIDRSLYSRFFDSMEMDLDQKNYSKEQVQMYIGGSAEAVGLMCLQVFCYGDTRLYRQLASSAKALGAAFQKINFLRDLREDFNELGRSYFGIELSEFDRPAKRRIEIDIAADLEAGMAGMARLPKSSRWGVYLAYLYYQALFKKIKRSTETLVIQKRIRLENAHKISLFAYSYFKFQFRLI